MGNGPTLSANLDPAVLLTLGDMNKAAKVAQGEIKKIEQLALKAENSGKKLDEATVKRLRRMEDIERQAKRALDTEKKAAEAQTQREKKFRSLQTLQDKQGRGLLSGSGMAGLSGLDGGSFRGGLGDIRDAGQIIQGINRGGIDGAQTAIGGLRGLVPMGGALGVGLAGAATALNLYDQGRQSTRQEYEARTTTRNALSELGEKYGFRNTAKGSEDLLAQFRKEQNDKLGPVDKFFQTIGVSNQGGAGIRGITDALGITTRQGEVDKKAAAEVEAAVKEAMPMLDKGIFAAQMGDVASAEKEFTAANAKVKIPVATRLGSPAEIYARTERAKWAEKTFSEPGRQRPHLRTGD